MIFPALSSSQPFVVIMAADGRCRKQCGPAERVDTSVGLTVEEQRGFLRQASQRARQIAAPANIGFCAREDDRATWEGPLWFTRPENRFLFDSTMPAPIAAAAVMLKLAQSAPCRPIVLLPTNYWIAKESVLRDAIELALWSLPRFPNGIATLGMADTHADSEEDYLVLGQGNGHTGAVIHAYVRKPGAMAAKQLKAEGAVVASGILIGYSHSFAAHIRRLWPRQASALIGASHPNDVFPRKCCFPAAEPVSSISMGEIRLTAPVFPCARLECKAAVGANRSRAILLSFRPRRGSRQRPRSIASTQLSVRVSK